MSDLNLTEDQMAFIVKCGKLRENTDNMFDHWEEEAVLAVCVRKAVSIALRKGMSMQQLGDTVGLVYFVDGLKQKLEGLDD